MDAALTAALSERLLAMGDDELILAHRNSEWTGHAPILEEDIAFANIALDELGHAAIWYGLRETLTGETADAMVFFREPGDFRNVQLVELPKGDWAFSMVRQYLFDAAESVWLPQLAASAYQPLAEAAAKIRREEVYHLRHTSLWLRRLGLGTEESHRRTQAALDAVWPYARQLYVPLPGDALLVEAGYLPPLDALGREWEATVRPFLAECNLTVPDDNLPRRDIPRSEHTEALMALLAEMQAVARMDPTAEW
jgi:ring-1,2-phenylacetyl-CoA epoxidase subunit PaaC